MTAQEPRFGKAAPSESIGGQSGVQRPAVDVVNRLCWHTNGNTRRGSPEDKGTEAGILSRPGAHHLHFPSEPIRRRPDSFFLESVDLCCER